MKKTSFLLSLVLISAVLFSSCFSSMFARYTYMKNFTELSANESSIVVFDNSGSAAVSLTKWNGEDIGLVLYSAGASMNGKTKSQLIVPPGDNSFTFDIFFVIGETTYERRNIELQYFLAPGTKYIVKPRTKRTSIFKWEFYIGIYPDAKKSEPLKEWKLGES